MGCKGSKDTENSSSNTPVPPRKSIVANRDYSEISQLPKPLSESTYGVRPANKTEEEKYTAEDFFQFGTIVGSGATGVILRAKFLPDASIKAVKFVDNFAKNGRYVLAEIAALMMCQGQRYIVQYHSHFRVKKAMYIVTDLYEGGSLESFLEPHITLPPLLSRVYMKQMVLALQFLHSHHIAHRDINPSNIVLELSGNLRLIDLSCCRLINNPHGERITECGNPAYRAPEMYLDRLCTVAVDWWSLGVLLYRFVTGFEPFKADKLTEGYQSVTKLNVKFKKVSFYDEATLDLDKNLLKKDPKKRLGSKKDSGDIKHHPFFQPIKWDIPDNIADVIKRDFHAGGERHRHVYQKLYSINKQLITAQNTSDDLPESVGPRLMEHISLSLRRKKTDPSLLYLPGVRSSWV